MMGVRKPARLNSRQTSKPSLFAGALRSHDTVGRDFNIPALQPQVVFETEGDSRLVLDHQNSRHDELSGTVLLNGSRTLNVLPCPTSLDKSSSP